MRLWLGNLLLTIVLAKGLSGNSTAHVNHSSRERSKVHNIAHALFLGTGTQCLSGKKKEW